MDDALAHERLNGVLRTNAVGAAARWRVRDKLRFDGNDRWGSRQAAEGQGSVTSASLCQVIGEGDRIVETAAVAPSRRSISAWRVAPSCADP